MSNVDVYVPAPSRAVLLKGWAVWNRVTFRACIGLLCVFLGGSIILPWIGYEWTDWARRWCWPMALAAIVGYMTNYAAVEMLFQPYQPDHFHWLRLITLGLWRHGVVPSRKQEIARAVGDQFANRLLTPERIGREIIVVVERLLDDPELRRRIRYVLGPTLRKQLPVIVDRLTPEIMSLFRTASKTAFTQENVARFIEDVLQPWLADPNTRNTFVDIAVGFLRENAPRITDEIRRVTERYARTGLLRGIALWLAEKSGLVDWEEVRSQLQEYFGSYNTRRKFYALIAELTVGISQIVTTDRRVQSLLRELADQIRDVLGDRVAGFLKEYLPEMGNRLADSPSLWDWLAHEWVPSARPQIIAWLEQEGGGVYLARQFDVAAQVKSSIDELPVEEVHRMVDQVSANELGAIQVLGFILGGVSGGVMALLLFS